MLTNQFLDYKVLIISVFDNYIGDSMSIRKVTDEEIARKKYIKKMKKKRADEVKKRAAISAARAGKGPKKKKPKKMVYSSAGQSQWI